MDIGSHRIPSLNWLRVFEAAARMESFTGAAQILNMSTSAVSQQIGTLEHHLKTELFIRKPRCVVLSDAGLQLLPSVRHALLSIDASTSAVRGRSKSTLVRVLANSIFAMSWLAPRLHLFSTQHPDITVHLNNADYALETKVEDADVLITMGPAPHYWEHRANILPETLYPVATPEISASITAVSDLCAYRLIDVPSHIHSWINVLDSVEEAGATSPELVFVSTTNIALSMAAAGYGIALARAPVTDWLVERFGLVRCLPGLEITGDAGYSLTTRPSVQRNDYIEAFQQWIADQANSSAT